MNLYKVTVSLAVLLLSLCLMRGVAIVLGFYAHFIWGGFITGWALV